MGNEEGFADGAWVAVGSLEVGFKVTVGAAVGRLETVGWSESVGERVGCGVVGLLKPNSERVKSSAEAAVINANFGKLGQATKFSKERSRSCLHRAGRSDAPRQCARPGGYSCSCYAWRRRTPDR